MGNNFYYGLQKLLRSKLLKIETKRKTYETIIKPMILQGSESWTLTKVN
jgi:hypothetical protein